MLIINKVTLGDVLIQITNLHLNFTENDLQRLFTPFGELVTIEIVRDKLNNRSTGRAYVEMPVKKEAQNAIVNLHGTIINGKSIIVTETSLHA